MKNRSRPAGRYAKSLFVVREHHAKRLFNVNRKIKIYQFQCIMLTVKSQVLRTGKAPVSGLVWGINIPTIIEILSHRYIEGDGEKKRKEYPHTIDTQKGGGRCLNGKRRLIADHIERLT